MFENEALHVTTVCTILLIHYRIKVELEYRMLSTLQFAIKINLFCLVTEC